MMGKPRKKRSPIWFMAESDFRELIAKSLTIGEVLTFFGFSPAGNNWNTVVRAITYLTHVWRRPENKPCVKPSKVFAASFGEQCSICPDQSDRIASALPSRSFPLSYSSGIRGFNRGGRA